MATELSNQGRPGALSNLSGSAMGVWGNFTSFLSDVRAEMKKVVTPTRKEVQSTTIVVIVAVFIVGLYFFGIDNVIGRGVDLMHSLGRSRPMVIFGWRAHLGSNPLFISEHQPFRVYYITRNILMIARRYALSQPEWVARRLFMEVQSDVVRLLFGPRRMLSALAICKGALDFANARTGRIPQNVAESLAARSDNGVPTAR